MFSSIRLLITSTVLVGALPFAAGAAALPSPNPVPAVKVSAPLQVVLDRVAPPTITGLGNDVQDCYQYLDSNGRDCVNDFAAGDLGIVFSWQPCSDSDCVASTEGYAVYKVPPGSATQMVRAQTPVAPALPSDHTLVASGKYSGQVGVALIPASGFSVGDCFVVRAFAGSSPTSAHSSDGNVSCVTSQTRIGTTWAALQPAIVQGASATSTCGAAPAAGGLVGYEAFSPNSACPYYGTDWTKTWSVEYWVYTDFKIPATMYILDATFRAAGDLHCAQVLSAVGDNWEYGDAYPQTYKTMNFYGSKKLDAKIGSWLTGVQGTDISLEIAPNGQPPGTTCLSNPGNMWLDLTVLK
jgi:hypothetical protein